jgi:DNA-binding transcriptional regulator YiaG
LALKVNTRCYNLLGLIAYLFWGTVYVVILLDAQQIKELRLMLGLSIPEFAKRVGVTENALRYWERGERRPRWEAAKKLSDLWDQAKKVTS